MRTLIMRVTAPDVTLNRIANTFSNYLSQDNFKDRVDWGIHTEDSEGEPR